MSRRRGILRDERGAMAVLAAAVISLVVVLVGIVVDLGTIVDARRSLQSATDSAALAAAMDPPRAQAVAVAVFRDYGYRPDAVRTVTTGIYTQDAELAVEDRFVPDSGPDANAVEVASEAQTSLFFYGLLGVRDVRVTATARAVHIKEASLTAGTRLAGVNEGLLNAILGALFGSHLSLSAVDYNGLLHADVNLLRALDALALDLGLETLTYGELLELDVALGEMVDAALAVVTDPNARAALEALRAQTGLGEDVALGHLFDLGQWADRQVGEGGTPLARHAVVKAYDLLVATAQVANGGRLLELPLDVTLPGVADVQLALSLIEPARTSPRIGIGPEGVSVHTAQVRLLLDLTLLPILGDAARVPLYVELAHADANVTGIGCGLDPLNDGTVAVDARPGVAALHIADVNKGLMTNFSQPVSLEPARIVNLLGLLTIRARAEASLGPTDWRRLTFTQEEIRAGAVKTASSQHLLSGLVGSLSDDLVLDTGGVVGGLLNLVLGILGLDLDEVLEEVLNALQPLLAVIDDLLLDDLLRALGVQVGEVDVAVGGMRCGVPALVQ